MTIDSRERENNTRLAPPSCSLEPPSAHQSEGEQRSRLGRLLVLLLLSSNTNNEPQAATFSSDGATVGLTKPRVSLQSILRQTILTLINRFIMESADKKFSINSKTFMISREYSSRLRSLPQLLPMIQDLRSLKKYDVDRPNKLLLVIFVVRQILLIIS